MPRSGRERIGEGRPPATLTGQVPVSSLESAWWDHVMSWCTGEGGLVGRTLSIEELSGVIPSYPDGRRARPRTVARRLRPILELVERGPNGSRGRGATYRVMAIPVPPDLKEREDVGDDEIAPASDWLDEAVRRMTGEGEENG